MEGYFPVCFFVLTAMFVAEAAFSVPKAPPAKSAPVKKMLPKPIGQRLALAKDAKEQDLLLIEALKASPQSPILNYKMSSLSLQRGDQSAWRSAFALVQSSPLALNVRLMGELFREALADEQLFLAQALIDRGVLDQRWQSVCPFFELDRRKERGELFYHMARAPGLKKADRFRLWQELFIKLPEVIDGALLGKQQDFAAWQGSLSLEDMLLRIHNLMLFGKNKEAQETYEGMLARHLAQSPSERCALDYEGAKIQRKLRNYKEAKTRFRELAAACAEPVKKKARYMELQLTAMASDKSDLAKFDKFVGDYPLDGFSDDALLWKATILLDNNEKNNAVSVLESLIKQFPEGDMVERALFLKAFTHVALGEPERAKAELTTLRDKAAPDSLERAQARYWLARLGIYADLKASVVMKKQEKARSELLALAKDPQPTFYSWLAYKLLEDLKAAPALAKTARLPPLKEQAMSSDSLQFIRNLVELGFTSEALALLNEEPLDAINGAQIAAVAHLYLKLGQPEAGHQKLIRCDAKIAASLKKTSPAAFDLISWPKPFAIPVLEAAKRLAVPPQMITAVMRQESGFLKDALSWANARGAMQLIPSTANEQVARLGLEKIKPEDLFDPKLNILLGTSTLKNYWLLFDTLPLALSAYNAGPAAARKWKTVYKDLPVDAFAESIPFNETRKYLFAVLGNFISYAIRDGSKLPDFAIKEPSSPKAPNKSGSASGEGHHKVLNPSSSAARQLRS